MSTDAEPARDWEDTCANCGAYIDSMNGDAVSGFPYNVRLTWCNHDCFDAWADKIRLRTAAEEAVRDLYTAEGVAIWWADHDHQTPEEQQRRRRNVVALADGAFL